MLAWISLPTVKYKDLLNDKTKDHGNNWILMKCWSI